MKFREILRTLPFRNLLLTLLILLPILGQSIYTTVSIRNMEVEQAAESTRRLATWIAQHHQNLLASSSFNHYFTSLIADVYADDLPDDTTIILLDAQGTVLSRHPAAAGQIGQSLAQSTLFRTIQRRDAPDAILNHQWDDETRLYGFAPIGIGQQTRFYLVLGIPEHVALEHFNRVLSFNLGLLIAVLLFSLGLNWLGNRLLFYRPIQQLIDATHRLTQGDLTTRLGTTTSREFDQLAQAFNQMAATLQAREAENQTTHLALQQSQADYRRILDTSYEGIWMIDHQGLVTYANQRMAEIIGYTPGALLGCKVLTFMDAEAADQVRSLLKPQSGEMHTQFELCLRHKNGSPVWTLVAVTLNFDEAGTFQSALGMLTDITERKQMEGLLRKSEERFQHIAKATNDVLWEWDLVTHVEWWSEGLETVFGHSHEEIEYTVDWWIDKIHPDDRERVVSSIYEAIELREQWTAEYRYQRADGSYAYVHDSGYLICDETGTPIRMYGGISDITQQVEVKQELVVRVSQQAAVSWLGQQASAGRDLQEFMDEATLLVAHTLGVEYVKVLELMPGGERFLLRAGYGWAEGAVGKVTVENTMEAQSGYALHQTTPVVVIDFDSDARFCASDLLRQHNAVSGISVMIPGKTHPFGVLSAHSARLHSFTQDDANFLLSVANILSTLLERKRQEQALAESRLQLQGVIESALDAIITIDAHQQISLFNPAAEQLFGYSAAEVQGKPLSLLLPEGLAAQHQQHVQSFGQTDTTTRRMGALENVRGRCADGREVALEASISQMEVNGEKLYTAMVRDVTSRLERERERETMIQMSTVLRDAVSQEEMLPRVLDQLQTVLQAQGAAIALHQPEDDTIVLALHRGIANRTGCRIPWNSITGRVIRNGESFCSNNLAEIPSLFTPAEIEQISAGACVPLIVQGESMGALWVTRYRSSATSAPFRPNEVRLLEAIADMVANAIQRVALHDQVRSYAASLEKQVIARTAELSRALEDAQAADRLKSQFVSDVNHELRTPLSSIKLYLGLLQRGRPEKHAQYFEVLQRETNRLQGLIEELLDLSHLDTEKAPFQPQPINLHTVITTLVTERNSLMAEKNLTIQVHTTPSLACVMADSDLIFRVLTNLMSNAINYTPGGGHLVWDIREERDSQQRSWQIVRLKDSGPGLDADDLPHIFKRFYRGRAARDTGISGTGLGLAMCQEIMDRHEGYITAENCAEGGACFTLWFPLPTAMSMAAAEVAQLQV